MFDVVNPEQLSDAGRYNIAPTQKVTMVFRNRAGRRSAGKARWGLIPHWVENPSEWRAATFNARSEDVDRKPTFRQAFKRGRVLVPASGFYEWKREEGGKTPYHVRAKDGCPLAFAGLMDVWRDKQRDDEVLVSCAVLTAPSAGQLEDLHPRMPVIVQPSAFEAWLSSEEPGRALQQVLGAMKTDDLEVYPVSSEVNSARRDRPEFVLPLS